MRLGLQKLSEKIPKKLHLILGGGGALLLGHQIPLVTFDLDAISKGLTLSELDPLIKKVAKELNLPPDWLNPHFASFTHTLPADYTSRLVPIFEHKHLKVEGLGKEDLLIMKCFAHRSKDVSHALALINKKTNIEFVENHLDFLKSKNTPGADAALAFFQDVLDQTV